MQNRTWRRLEIAHKKLHEQKIPHDDKYFSNSYLIMRDIKNHPADWPIGLFTYHEGMWN